MITDHINNCDFYKGINEKIDQAIDYIKNANFAG
jgi:beta-galactosidase beta subunit